MRDFKTAKKRFMTHAQKLADSLRHKAAYDLRKNDLAYKQRVKEARQLAAAQDEHGGGSEFERVFYLAWNAGYGGIYVWEQPEGFCGCFLAADYNPDYATQLFDVYNTFDGAVHALEALI